MTCTATSAEWCWDWYGEGYYKESREDDPRGPAWGLGPGAPRRELARRPARTLGRRTASGPGRAAGSAAWASAWPWVSLAAELRWARGERSRVA